jgi:hypothetical protein
MKEETVVVYNKLCKFPLCDKINVH